MASAAFLKFEALLGSVDQLIDIHGRLQTGAGQDALHRSGVVLTVAAWQSYIEKVSNEALDWIETQILIVPNGEPPTPQWARSSFAFRKPAIKKSIGDLNTPNTQHVRRLLESSFGFDPKSHWVWVAPSRRWNASQYSDRTDEWLRIRHTIAHGVDLPSNMPWLRNGAGAPRLTLGLLEECKKHFHRKARLTDAAFSRHLDEEYGLPPW